MKQFLSFLFLGGAAIYLLLVMADNVISEVPENRSNDPIVRRLSAWGPYLPNQERQASLTTQIGRDLNPSAQTSGADDQPASDDTNGLES